MELGYQVLIPDSSRDMLPEFTLPAMDALQQLGHTPVTLSMASMSEMYHDLRLSKKGGYELFLFHARDVVRKGRLDFALSFGLSGILEDSLKAELHYLPEEFELPGLLYMHARDTAAAQRLIDAGAARWRHTVVCVSSASLAARLHELGAAQVRHMPLAYNPRVFYPGHSVPANPAFPLQLDDARLSQGYAVSFVGAWTEAREELLAALHGSALPLAVFGDQAWGRGALAAVYRGPVKRLSELNTVYNCSAVNLDLPAAGAAPDDQPDYVSPRVVECLGSGGFLLAVDQPGLSQFGCHESELAICHADELVDASEYWLANAEGRAALAAAGLARVEAEAQWRDRLRIALGWLEIATLAAAA